MSNPYRVSKQRSPELLLRQESRRNPVSGFSLIELMVAMSLFLVVAGAAITLVRRHMPMFNTAQNQTAINIALRNAVAQLQMEVVNAGTGFSGATPVAFSPMGATIAKAANANCKATATYVAGCFDSLQLISVDSSVPPLAPSNDAAGTTQVDTTGGTTIYLTIPGNPAGATSAYLPSLKAGTELMLIQGGTDVGVSGKPAIAIVVLKVDAIASGTAIQLTTTAATQSNVACGSGPNVSGVPAASAATVNPNDILGIYDAGECDRFIGTFKPQWDYVVKLVAGAKYSVDATTDPTNPKLVRTAAGVQDIIAEQIIGFTVGAWSSQRIVGGVVSPGYTITPSDYSSDWASVRSIQVQIVARATPNGDNAVAFTNSYDQGNYQVQGISVVINPRNLNTN
jgi:prepilin-type N-terminal cleavage/methylation domain-containing protein